MAANGRFVTDTSTILSWLMPDEKSRLDLVIDKFKDKELCAPNLLVFEVCNALQMAIKRKRISAKQAIEILEDFGKFQIDFYDLGGDVQEILQVSIEHNLTAYDASYYVLAKHLNCKLLSLDKKLAKLI